MAIDIEQIDTVGLALHRINGRSWIVTDAMTVELIDKDKRQSVQLYQLWKPNAAHGNAFFLEYDGYFGVPVDSFVNQLSTGPFTRFEATAQQFVAEVLISRKAVVLGKGISQLGTMGAVVNSPLGGIKYGVYWILPGTNAGVNLFFLCQYTKADLATGNANAAMTARHAPLLAASVFKPGYLFHPFGPQFFAGVLGSLDGNPLSFGSPSLV